MAKRTSKGQMIFKGYGILAALAARVEEHKSNFGVYPKVLYMWPADYNQYVNLPGMERLFFQLHYRGIPVVKLEVKHEVPTGQ